MLWPTYVSIPPSPIFYWRDTLQPPVAIRSHRHFGCMHPDASTMQAARPQSYAWKLTASLTWCTSTRLQHWFTHLLVLKFALTRIPLDCSSQKRQWRWWGVMVTPRDVQWAHITVWPSSCMDQHVVNTLWASGGCLGIIHAYCMRFIVYNPLAGSFKFWGLLNRKMWDLGLTVLPDVLPI